MQIYTVDEGCLFLPGWFVSFVRGSSEVQSLRLQWRHTLSQSFSQVSVHACFRGIIWAESGSARPVAVSAGWSGSEAAASPQHMTASQNTCREETTRYINTLTSSSVHEALSQSSVTNLNSSLKWDLRCCPSWVLYCRQASRRRQRWNNSTDWTGLRNDSCRSDRTSTTCWAW